jgi:uncharacterized membrane protein YhaH (DUF805 family)
MPWWGWLTIIGYAVIGVSILIAHFCSPEIKYIPEDDGPRKRFPRWLGFPLAFLIVGVFWPVLTVLALLEWLAIGHSSDDRKSTH